ncbi:hypothetical protein GUITHDRAFT_110911 [Guillardia theta CCMP2712]|uniref:Uncharacterized protein n=1 Tax=Guillardia theta (strain CCMP2712) TaxID=905079 RepID=L1J4Y6_GUITC|nr:hypothetical protein GUITHDRAFT_110911 [Guillardia theta CCMP2712]EKX43184.1 hypothetical protein GUITHDRAFT_110911 [Guillardia theta CCMP2712]|eukprot:XP_005830164.1 hypothetical protein GUITHDRAFT_110911 [Guillardia theta CCMP2712]
MKGEAQLMKGGRENFRIGFGRGLNRDEPATRRAFDGCKNIIQERQAKTVIWDGDNWENGGFTSVIPELVKEQDVLLVAVLYEEDQDRFLDSWGDVIEDKSMMALVLVPAEDRAIELQLDKYVDLGLYGIFMSQSTCILCLGCGKVVQEEIVNMERYMLFKMTGQEPIDSKLKVEWKVFPLTRMVGEQLQQSFVPRSHKVDIMEIALG